MSLRRLALVVLCALLLAGCQMPAKGTPVFVDMRAGDFWSGEGLLLDVSEDGGRCRVALRDRTWLVRKMWVDCGYVHATRVRHRAAPTTSSP